MSLPQPNSSTGLARRFTGPLPALRRVWALKFRIAMKNLARSVSRRAHMESLNPGKVRFPHRVVHAVHLGVVPGQQNPRPGILGDLVQMIFERRNPRLQDCKSARVR